MNVTSKETFAAHKILKSFSALALIFLHIFILFAVVADAQLDPTFGTNGVTKTDFSNSDTPIAVFLLPDGKILSVIGYIPSSNGIRKLAFVRYNSNGSIDTAYGVGGIADLPVTFSGPNNAARQSDGKIILVGIDGSNGMIARFNEDATLDTSFAAGGIHRPNINQIGADGITDVVIQPDGKILVSGYTAFHSFFNIYLLRYTSNGFLDESFGNEGYIIHTDLGVTQGSPQFLFLQSSGKIVTVSAVDVHTPTSGSARRFNSDGTIDNSFSTIFFPYNRFQAAAMQPDDKILIASYVQKNDSLERQHFDTSVSRFNADGSVDTNFGSGGQSSFDVTNYFDDIPIALEVLPNGDILVLARTDVQPNRSQLKGLMLSLVRLSPNGAVAGKMLVANSLAHYRASILPQPDGKIVLFDFASGPTVNNTDILLARVVGVPLQTYRLRGIPFNFKYQAFNGGPPVDGNSDPAVFRPSERKWYFNNLFPGFFFGLADDILTPSDYIGDFTTDLAVFRPSNGTWYIAKSYANAATNYITVQWGQNGDVPAPADYDGDGKSDITVFRPSNGVWYVLNSTDGSNRFVQWGTNGDKPVSGDYDGDGLYDIAVFRPSDGNWYVLKSSDGQALIIHFGLSGDIPVQEDYDGDGKTDISVYRPSEGVWYRLNSFDGSFYALQWAIPADIPVPADYDGDLKTDIAVWRQSSGRWYVYQSSTNSMVVYNWGMLGDKPLQMRN